MLAADFETTTDPKDCRVWSWGVANVGEAPIFHWGTDIESFMDFIMKEPGIVYFHNLKFDGSFILNWLLTNGYSCVEDSKLSRGEFTCLISNQGQYYSISVRGQYGTVEFRDSLKAIPLPISEIPAAFKLDGEAKGEIDYDKPRPVGYMPDEDELSYLRSDVVILAKALHIQHSEGATRLTAGANALADYKESHSKKWWQETFPVLDGETDALIRKAYRGGFTYADPRFAKRVVGPVKVFDVNSLYPSVMYFDLLPHGRPVWVDGMPEVTEDRPLFIAHIVFTAKVKPDHIPCIQIKATSFYGGTEYLSEIDEPVDMWVSSVDLELWQEQYDLNIECWYGAFTFKARRGMFKDFIDRWMEVKATSSGGRRLLAKLQLNNLYGKFATNPDVTGKYPVLDKGVLRLVTGTADTRDPVYTAMGVFITGYARMKTLRAAQAHYDVFAYADTDSLHLITDTMPDDLDVDGSRLGWWAHEGDFDRGFYARAKCYTEARVRRSQHRMVPDRWEYDTHIAGLPRSAASRVRFGHYMNGETVFDGKLVPRQVPGGVVLSDVGFRLVV